MFIIKPYPSMIFSGGWLPSLEVARTTWAPALFRATSNIFEEFLGVDGNKIFNQRYLDA